MAQSLSQDIFQSLSPTALSNAAPQPNGVASAGTAPQASRADHVHASGVTGALTFDITPAVPPYAEGNVYWDQSNKTLIVETGTDDVTLQVGQESYVRVSNVTGATITNGKVVYINGSSGTRPTIALANANSQITSDSVIGLATHDIENATEGFVTVFGLVNGINTALYPAGTTLYLSTVNGGVTAIQPSSPDHAVRVGYVITQNAVTGSIYVDVQIITQNANSIHIDSGVGVTQLNNVQDFFRLSWGAGVSLGAAITDNLDGTVDIASGEVLLRQTNANDGILEPMVLPAQAGITATADDVSWLYVDYNAGTPQWVVTTDFTQCNGHDKIMGFGIGRNGTRLNIVDLRQLNINASCRSAKQKVESDGFIYNGWWRSKFAKSVLGAAGLNLTTTAGRYYFIDTEFTHTAFDTSVAGTADANVFKYFYNRTGAWTQIADQKAINSTQYDAGGVLTTMNNNKWRTDWVYVVMGVTPYLAVVLGNTEYDSIANAQASSQPSALPPQIDGVAVLVGQVVIQKSAVSMTVQAASSASFAGGSASVDHNNLGGIQGGAAATYYHSNQPINTTDVVSFQGYKRNTDTVSANTSLDNTYDVVYVDSTAASRTITLPASTNTGREYTIVKISTANSVTIVPTGGDTVQFDTSILLTQRGTSLNMVEVSGGWIIK